MKKITIYSGTPCSRCDEAKALLKRKNIEFNEINLGEQRDKMNEMLQRSGCRRTFQQIFVGETHVGGSDELYALEKAGRLNSLLDF